MRRQLTVRSRISAGPTDPASRRGPQAPVARIRGVRIVVIGAGISGLACARRLRAAGREVVVVEKSRGPGGRLSTRRDGEDRYDHGAPDVGADPAPFARYRGRLAPGPEGRLVPVPRTSALPRAMAAGLDLRAATRAVAVRGGAVILEDGAILRARAVVVTAPAPQAAELLAEGSPALAARAAAVAYDPCWSVMARWDVPLPLPDALGPTGPLARAARESARPGRAPGERWVLQASAAWSAAHLEDDPAGVAAVLAWALHPAPPAALDAHRWRYATVRTPLGVPFLRDGDVFAAGDWCAGPRVVDALRSGEAAADALLEAQPTSAGAVSFSTVVSASSRSTSRGSTSPAPRCWVDSAPQATP